MDRRPWRTGPVGWPWCWWWWGGLSSGSQTTPSHPSAPPKPRVFTGTEITDQSLVLLPPPHPWACTRAQSPPVASGDPLPPGLPFPHLRSGSRHPALKPPVMSRLPLRFSRETEAQITVLWVRPGPSHPHPHPTQVPLGRSMLGHKPHVPAALSFSFLASLRSLKSSGSHAPAR